MEHPVIKQLEQPAVKYTISSLATGRVIGLANLENLTFKDVNAIVRAELDAPK